MHRLAYLAALHDESRLHTLAYADEVVVYGRNGKQRWDGSMLLVNVAVREDDVVHTLVNRFLCFVTEVVKCLAKSFLALLHFKEYSEFLCLETFITYVAQNVELCVGEHRLRQAHHLAV